jgi:hypothetical protein
MVARWRYGAAMPSVLWECPQKANSKKALLLNFEG